MSWNRGKIFLITLVVLGFFSFVYYLYPSNAVRIETIPRPKTKITPIDTRSGWAANYAMAKKMDLEYCNITFPYLENSALVNINFHQKSFKMALHMNNDFVSNEIIRSKSWEVSYSSNAVGLLLNLKQKLGDVVFIDVGANVGWFTLIVASQGIPVYAIEAMDANCDIIRHNLCLNNFNDIVTLLQTGVGDKEDTCRIVSHVTNQGDGIVECGVSPDQPLTPGYVSRQMIRLVTMDNLFGTDAITKPIGLMKIDIEGSEPKLFAGAKQFFAKYKPIYVIVEVLFIKTVEGRQAFYDTLNELGYSLFHQNCQANLDLDSFLVVGPNQVNDICFGLKYYLSGNN